MKSTVFVIGLGLIGSSLCANLKAENKLIGWDTSTATCQTALELNLIDEIASSIHAASQADFILLAVPVKAAIDYLQKLAKLPLKADVIVTDTGSTKKLITKVAQNCPFTFVGGHPMAGSHKSGVSAVNQDLFEEAYYILTPEEKSAGEKVRRLLEPTRSKFVLLAPKEHDQIVAVLSHLPHIVAASLVDASNQLETKYPGSRKLAAGGFRDMTRIASSDPTMWTDILLTNQTELLPLLKQWQQATAHVIQLLEQNDQAEIFRYFAQAKTSRDHLPQQQAGTLPAFYDLFVDIPDHPGTIANVTQVISQTGSSLINLQIQETREDIWGILELTFRTETDRLKAKQAIETQTEYHCHLRGEENEIEFKTSTTER